MDQKQCKDVLKVSTRMNDLNLKWVNAMMTEDKRRLIDIVPGMRRTARQMQWIEGAVFNG